MGTMQVSENSPMDMESVVRILSGMLSALKENEVLLFTEKNGYNWT